jgi:hypothetical protein
MRILLLFLFAPFVSFAQSVNIDSIFATSGEIYFSFYVDSKEDLHNISGIVSLDHGTTLPEVFAYANKKEFTAFANLNIPFTIEPKPGSLFKDLNMLISLEDKQLNNWDFYPSYEVYVEMMYAFESEYPNLCSVSSIGTSVDGRELLVAKITDSLTVQENEPHLLYTSSMHGDEIAGFPLSLRLIDYLLSNYETDERIAHIVNNVELWINPLANPDGAYTNNNNTVFNAQRYNSNWVDLNRNYPDPEDGPHSDGNQYQPETEAFMAFADSVGFDISSNFHGGAEVANYPWDTWATYPADYDWWLHVMNEYAGFAQDNSENGYFTSYDNGITNGYDWYEVNGGRQDYMNYFHHCREFTLEISQDKTPAGDDLPYYWDANYNSFLAYIEQSIYGVHGIVTDSLTGEPLLAEVFIASHDMDNSHVYSNLPIGDYHRYLLTGNYTLTFSAEGYISKSVSVDVSNNQTAVLDVQLLSNNVRIKENLAVNLHLFPQPASSYITVTNLPETTSTVYILDALGKRLRTISTVNTQTLTIQKENLSAGTYFLVFVVDGVAYKKEFVFR